MQRILTALVLIPLTLLLILRAPVAVLALMAGMVALLAIREFLALTRHSGVEPFREATYLFVGLFFGTLAVAGGQGIFALLNAAIFVALAGYFAVLAPFVFLSLGMAREKLSSIYPAASASVFAFTYIAIPMGMLVQMRQQPSGALVLIYLMVVVWSGDIFAYFVGKSMGRHKMSPRISPGKTWEGAAASLLASVGFGTLLYHFSPTLSQTLVNWGLLNEPGIFLGLSALAAWQIVLLSAVLNLAAQLGDLVESAIKRGAEVKDSGAILPGHGGMLDRIDALLFAAPVLCVLWFSALWANGRF